MDKFVLVGKGRENFDFNAFLMFFQIDLTKIFFCDSKKLFLHRLTTAELSLDRSKFLPRLD